MEKTVGTTKCMGDRYSPVFTLSEMFPDEKDTLLETLYRKFHTLFLKTLFRPIKEVRPPPLPPRPPSSRIIFKACV